MFVGIGKLCCALTADSFNVFSGCTRRLSVVFLRMLLLIIELGACIK